MTVRALRAEDAPALVSFLSDYAESSMFLLSNMARAGIGNPDVPYGGEYWAAFDDGEKIAGVAAHYWNGNIMVQAPQADYCQRLAGHLRMNIKRPVAGVLGPDEQVLALLEAFRLEAAEYTLNVAENLFSLSRETYLPAGPSDPHLTMVHWADVDAEILRSWLLAYRKEALGQEPTEAVEAAVSGELANARDFDRFVLLLDGVPVCLAGFNARYEDMVQVGPVWTPPEGRRRGYARYLLGRMLERAFEEGMRRSILFTGTFHAARAYRALGFALVGDYRLAILSAPVAVG
ncbi:UNVERIFIED_ORG: putative GNAT family acetyltransferase [Martelella mediterranea]